ncbi:MAG: hypothetical protein A2W91_03990 [Bacteroidetes bacterium GWF2_38_335]|nr:MAG: hypothetical protein A2W91_03990 [Bacteroidetes bacterium GWF2_38_335]OFY79112.1 MAG: hypothetical protein A2281_03325 [Bacteroidetes bacterium RIFOXYA12_FULL_38_20]HBS88802.1 hypothetical protein [Bacteroidales bacterium]
MFYYYLRKKEIMKKQFLLITSTFLIMFLIQYQGYGQQNNQNKFNLTDIFKTFPDNLFEISKNELGHQFTLEVRNILLSEEHFNDKNEKYEINGTRLNEIISGEVIDEVIENEYSIKINQKSNHAQAIFSSENEYLIQDFILIPENKSYSIILVEQYIPGMGNPSRKYISRYNYNPDQKTYTSVDISFPGVVWTDFYSNEVIEDFNQYYIEDVPIPCAYYVLDIDEQVFLSISPDIEEFVYGFVGTLNHQFEEESNMGEDFEMTKDSLGLNYLPDPKGIYYTLDKLKSVLTNEFELVYLYDQILINKSTENTSGYFQFSTSENKWIISIAEGSSSIVFEKGQLIISREMMNKVTDKISFLKSSDNRLLVVSSNSSGMVSKSEIAVYETNGLKIKQEITKTAIPVVTPEEMGLKLPENSFEKYKEYLAPKFEFTEGTLVVSLIINPTFNNKEMENIISKISDTGKMLVFKWDGNAKRFIK